MDLYIDLYEEPSNSTIKEKKKFNLKMGKRLEQKFHQKRYTEGMKTLEKYKL